MSEKPEDYQPKVRDGVVKSGGDYSFYGDVVAVFTKRSGAVRCVVENDAGILHIFSPVNLKLVHRPSHE
jgi:hypothetical protein